LHRRCKTAIVHPYDLLCAYKVCTYIKKIITDNVEEINKVVKQFHSNESFAEPIIGDYEMITNFPTMTIFPTNFNITPQATDYTLENVINITLEVWIKNAMREVELRYLSFLGWKIVTILLSPENLSPVLYNTYDPTAVDDDPRSIYKFTFFGDFTFTKRDDNNRGLIMPAQASEWIRR